MRTEAGVLPAEEMAWLCAGLPISCVLDGVALDVAEFRVPLQFMEPILCVLRVLPTNWLPLGLGPQPRYALSRGRQILTIRKEVTYHALHPPPKRIAITLPMPRLLKNVFSNHSICFQMAVETLEVRGVTKLLGGSVRDIKDSPNSNLPSDPRHCISKCFVECGLPLLERAFSNICGAVVLDTFR